MNGKLKDLNDIRLPNAEGGLFFRVFSSLLPFKFLHQTSPNPNLFTSPKKSKMAAFSLIELMVTLSVLAIVLTMAIPALRTMLMNSRVSANTDGFINALNFARNTALTQSVDVEVCPIGALNSTTCGANWTSGWIVATRPATGLSTLLQSQQTTTTDATVTSSTSSVTFDSHGLATTQSNFAVCDSRGGTFARSIQVQPTGYVQSGQTVGTAVWNNGAIACP